MSLLDVTSSVAPGAASPGTILVDSAGAILFVNREALDILCREASDLIGQPLEKVIADFHRARHPGSLSGDLHTTTQLLPQQRSVSAQKKRWFQPSAGKRGLRTARRSVQLRIVTISDQGGHPQPEVYLDEWQADSRHELGQPIRSPYDPSERMRALSRQLMELQENERRHIARELHDEIGQSLTAVKLNLETILRLPNQGGVEPHLYDSIAIVEHILQQVRALSLDLRPSLLDDLGLRSALPWYLGRQAERAGFTAEFSTDLTETHLSPEIEITCFRVVQEALTNIIRHAHAKHVWIELRQRDTLLELVVVDNGVGFDVRQALGGASLGLVGMQERLMLVGGELVIESALGRGTTLRAQIPLARALMAGSGTADGVLQGRCPAL